jgi:hypothetical protein
VIERILLPTDLVAEIERRAIAEGLEPAELASRLIVEELPRLVADLLVPRENVADSRRGSDALELGHRDALTAGSAP